MKAHEAYQYANVIQKLKTRIRELEAQIAGEPTHRHVKRGSTYRKLGEAEGQISVSTITSDMRPGREIYEGDKLVIYQAEDGKMWWRFPDEFEDGRFETLK